MRLIQPTGYVQMFKNKLVLYIPADAMIVVKEANFSHPRMLVGDFELTTLLMASAIKAGYPARWFPIAPRLVIHPKEMLEGGFTEIEARVLREVALAAGARAVTVWQGEDLSGEQVSAFKF